LRPQRPLNSSVRPRESPHFCVQVQAYARITLLPLVSALRWLCFSRPAGLAVHARCKPFLLRARLGACKRTGAGARGSCTMLGRSGARVWRASRSRRPLRARNLLHSQLARLPSRPQLHGSVGQAGNAHTAHLVTSFPPGTLPAFGSSLCLTHRSSGPLRVGTV
jgi:hypothetical protein